MTKSNEAFRQFWAESATASVLADYRAGAVVTLKAGKGTSRAALNEMLAEARARRTERTDG